MKEWFDALIDELDVAKTRIRKLEDRIKELEEERDGALEAYNGREKAIDQAIEGIVKLKKRVTELEDGIRKHRDSPIIFRHKVGEDYDRDDELYQLLED